jgi:preprotein translocase subunit SecA
LLLWTLDEKWRDHLFELDHLKSGIGLRAYGQKDPLIEYKKEAFDLFQNLLDDVREESLRRLFRVQLAEAPPPMPRRPVQMVARHDDAGGISRMAAASESSAPAKEPATDGSATRNTRESAPARPARGMLRAGRNDPCPCGSGKKYKKCHLPADEGVAV